MFGKVTEAEMRKEAIRRLHTLVNEFALGPKLENCFAEGKLYYSYGYSMDTINFDNSYADSVKAFKSAYNCLVYHAVESQTPFGKMLSFLYVGSDKRNWSGEELSGKTIISYAYIVDDGWDLGEFWDAMIDIFGLENLYGVCYGWRDDSLCYLIGTDEGDI